MIPGEIEAVAGEIVLNAGRKTVVVQVTNSGDRPIQVGSHYHFFETNSALKFERKQSYGFRLNIAAGTAVRFEPGQSRTVLVEGAGLDAVVPASGGGVSINSPFVSVVPSSVRRVGMTPNNLPYIAFTVSVRADAPTGDYTLRFRTASGEVALMAGGISVETFATGIVSNYEPESSLAFVAPLGKSNFRNLERFGTKQEDAKVVVFGNRAAADDLDLHF